MVIWGDTGFLGKNLILSLTDYYDEILGVSSGSVRIYRARHVEEVGLDVVGRRSVKVAIFAASMRYNPSLYREEPTSVYSKNMEAFTNFIKFLSNNKVEEVILLSSHVVYGQSKGVNDENVEVNIKSLSSSEFYYGSAKVHQEDLLIEFCIRNSIKFTVLRIPSLYGPHATLNVNQAHVIPSFIMRLLQVNSREIQAFGTGNEMRDFLYVEDLIRIIRQTIDSPSEIMNIAPQSFVSIRELGDEILKLISMNKNICFSNSDAVSNSFYRRVSTKKFEEKFPNFSFTGLKIGLQATIDYYRANLEVPR